MTFLKQVLFALIGLAMLAAPYFVRPAFGVEEIEGPIPARVFDVVDGDTVWVRAKIWLGLEVTTKVRLAGIDAPESGGRAACGDEAEKAKAAKSRLEALVLDRQVFLRSVRPDKWGGRVGARLISVDGRDVSKTLLAEGVVNPYDQRSDGWCRLKQNTFSLKSESHAR